jgi:serine/threonine protein kinase
MKIMKKRKYSGLLNFVLTEKEVSRKVRHPSIVRLYYAFQTFDKLYLLTEFCAGGDLRALMNSKGAPKKGLSEAEAKLYLAEVLVAIEELHKNGILHRDIKPENIMLDSHGHAKLTDFGLSKEGMFEKKQTNTFLGGGRSYQIPEVLKEAPYDKSVDLYLYGLLVYELLIGRPTFPSDVSNIEEKILSSTYSIPQEAGLSKDAKDLIQRLVLSQPEKRLNL